MTAKKINIGLLGLGRIAGHHCKAIKKIKNFKIVAACDLFKEKRENYLKHKGIKIYDHYDKELTKYKVYAPIFKNLSDLRLKTHHKL